MKYYIMPNNPNGFISKDNKEYKDSPLIKIKNSDTPAIVDYKTNRQIDRLMKYKSEY